MECLDKKPPVIWMQPLPAVYDPTLVEKNSYYLVLYLQFYNASNYLRYIKTHIFPDKVFNKITVLGLHTSLTIGNEQVPTRQLRGNRVCGMFSAAQLNQIGTFRVIMVSFRRGKKKKTALTSSI